MDTDLTGIPEVQTRLRHVLMQMTQAAGPALYDEGNRIMGVSVELVPIDTGLLRSSAHVERPVITGQEVVVELSYGSKGTVPYAAIVHESTEMNHPNGGQHHFLSEPFFAATTGMLQRLATMIRAQMGG